MAQHFKVHELLSAPELEELERFAREPGRTTDECHQWLLERGFTLSRSGVGNWLQHFREQLTRERFSRSGELAKVIRTAVEAGSFDDVAAAANMQLVNVVFEQSARLQAEGDVDGDTVESMTRSLKNLVGTKAQHTKLLAERFDTEAKKLVAKRREITPEDIDEVRKAVFG